MNFAQVEKQLKKVKDLEQHINYFYNPRAVCIKGYSKHQYIKEIMKDLKFDADVYEQNPFKKYVNQTLKRENESGKKTIRDLVEQTKAEIFQKTVRNPNESGLNLGSNKKLKRVASLQKTFDKNSIDARNIEDRINQLNSKLPKPQNSQRLNQSDAQKDNTNLSSQKTNEDELNQFSQSPIPFKHLNTQNFTLKQRNLPLLNSTSSEHNLIHHENELQDFENKYRQEDLQFKKWMVTQKLGAEKASLNKAENKLAMDTLQSEENLNILGGDIKTLYEAFAGHKQEEIALDKDIRNQFPKPEEEFIYKIKSKKECNANC